MAVSVIVGLTGSVITGVGVLTETVTVGIKVTVGTKVIVGVGILVFVILGVSGEPICEFTETSPAV